MGGLLQHVADVAELDELACIHHGNVIAEPSHDTKIVADEQEGDALVGSEARQQAENLRFDCDVERCRRLVQDKQRRFTSESRSDQRPLLHPARQLVRVGTGDLGGTIDPHLAQRGLGAAQRVGERQPEMLHHRFGDLPADPQRRVEGRERILKDSTDPPPKDVSPLHWRELSEVLALEQDGAGDLRRWAEKIQNCTGDTALARPGFTDNGERTVRLEREADIAHGGDVPVALAIADREIADLEQWFGARPGLGVHRRLPSFGSSTSRNPSPTRLMPMTVMLIAIPGASEIHGAVSTKARPLLIIRPQSAAGGCTPKPRKLSTAPNSPANTTRRLASTTSTGQTLGSSSRINK